MVKCNRCKHPKRDHEYIDYEPKGKCKNRRLMKPSEKEYDPNCNTWVSCGCPKFTLRKIRVKEK